MFLVLTRTLHFGKASQALHISASGLTRAIQRLEQELEVILFERDKRSVRLTAEGHLVKEFANDVIDRLGSLQNALHADTLVRGVLSLFCSVTASYSFLQHIMQQFRAEYPQVELQLHTGDSAQALSRVGDELESLAIAALPDQLPDNLEFLPLGESPLVCIGPSIECPLRQYLQRASRQGTYDWSRIPLIVSETGLSRQRLEQWFQHRHIKPQIYAQVSGHEAMVSMVSLGCGVAVVPRVVVDNSPMSTHIEVLPVMAELEPFTIGLCALKKRLANPLVDAFWSVAAKSSQYQGH